MLDQNYSNSNLLLLSQYDYPNSNDIIMNVAVNATGGASAGVLALNSMGGSYNNYNISNYNNKNDILYYQSSIDNSIMASSTTTTNTMALELSSFLRILAHELSLEEYASVENSVFSYIFALIHSNNTIETLAGVCALDALIGMPSADEEKKAIKFANIITNALRVSYTMAHTEYVFVNALTRCLGKMAIGSANVDYVEFEVTRALEWLGASRNNGMTSSSSANGGNNNMSSSSSCPDRRLAACLVWKELACNAPSSIYAKTFPSATVSGNHHTTASTVATNAISTTFVSSMNTNYPFQYNDFMNLIFPIIWDKHAPMLRACAVDALAECLKLLLVRKHKSTTSILCYVYMTMMEGFQSIHIQQGVMTKNNANPNNSGTVCNVDKEQLLQHKSNNDSFTIDNNINRNLRNKFNNPHHRHHNLHKVTLGEEAMYHGSLLLLGEMLDIAKDFMIPRFEEVCDIVIYLSYHRYHPRDESSSLIRLEVVRLIPRLAVRVVPVFKRKYMDYCLKFLIDCANSSCDNYASSSTTSSFTKIDVNESNIFSGKKSNMLYNIDIRPAAFVAIGQLALVMYKDTDDIDDDTTTSPSKRAVNVSNHHSSSSSSSFDHNMAYTKNNITTPPTTGIHARMEDIFKVIQKGLQLSSDTNNANTSSSSAMSTHVSHHHPITSASVVSSHKSSTGYNHHNTNSDYTKEVLYCAASLVEALGKASLPYVGNLVNHMFDCAGLSEELIDSLYIIANCLQDDPVVQVLIKGRLLQEISTCLGCSTSNTSSTNNNNTTAAAALVHSRSPRKRSSSSASTFSNTGIPTAGTSTNVKKDIDYTKNPSSPHNNIASSTNNIYQSTNTATMDFWNLEHQFQQYNGCWNDIPIIINKSDDPIVVSKIVLSLRTLTTIGADSQTATTRSTLLLPFINNVVAQYLSHSTIEARKEAALTCCRLLLLGDSTTANTKSVDKDDDFNKTGTTGRKKRRKKRKKKRQAMGKLGSTSRRLVESVLKMLLRVAVSDSSPIVRHCVVTSFDSRYDVYLCQTHHLPCLFLLLQDEFLAVRAASLQLLGRLALLNPAYILPPLRRVLMELIMELRCGTEEGREAATRLLIVFLRAEALHRVIHPFLSAIIQALPLDKSNSITTSSQSSSNSVPPRLASAALEALGELAQVSRKDLTPWISQLMPCILQTMQDQSSASKQKISLRTLGQIAGGTGYVINPYLDYPQLLSQAVDVLPTTKRAPWHVRREVIRTLGILGALDPNRYLSAVFLDVNNANYKTRKAGGVGVGYFFMDHDDTDKITTASMQHHTLRDGIYDNEIVISMTGLKSFSCSGATLTGNSMNMPSIGSNSISKRIDKRSNDDNEPAHLYMYEQYSAEAQPASKLSPSRRLTPSSEDFYPTVAVHALTRILKDSSLAVHHGMGMQAIMFIFNALGLRCVPFLKQIVPHILQTILSCGSNVTLREALLQQVASLSGIVREHLRPYVPAIFEVVEELWFRSSHLSTILLLVCKMAKGVPDEFRPYVSRFVKLLLVSLEAPRGGEWNVADVDRLELILRNIDGLRCILGDYLHLLVPVLLKLTDFTICSRGYHQKSPYGRSNFHQHPTLSSANDTDGSVVTQEKLSTLSVLTIKTLTLLLSNADSPSFNTLTISKYTTTTITTSSLPARVVQPFMRMLGRTSVDESTSKPVGYAIVEALCVCARALGPDRWRLLYHIAVRRVILDWSIRAGDVSVDGSEEIVVSAPTNDNKNIILPRQGIYFGNDVVGLAFYDEAIHQLNRNVLLDGTELVHDTVSSSDEILQQHSGEDSGMDGNSMFNDEYNTGSRGFMGNLNAGNLNVTSNGGEFDNYTTAFESNGDIIIVPQTSNTQLPSSSINQPNRLRVNQAKLQRIWDVSQCTTREDWDEWMRRFAVQLLREAPSPSLRACAGLAHAYQPLARELFSAAFSCCWAELKDSYRIHLVRSLEAAFVAKASPEILQTLLNLAEFMEHFDGDSDYAGLPIDIAILADLALRCCSYAKALHYKEGEYNRVDSYTNADATRGNVHPPLSRVVESLISIQKKLDLPEAALGVLKFAQQKVEINSFSSHLTNTVGYNIPHSDILRAGISSSQLYQEQQERLNTSDEQTSSSSSTGINNRTWLGLEVQESWLVKLGSWSEALTMYERKLKESPNDVTAILGCMSCLNARGEWRRVLDLATKSWSAIMQDEHTVIASVADTTLSSDSSASRSYKKSLKFCAQASWRLGQWDDLEVYASKLCRGMEFSPSSFLGGGSSSGSGISSTRANDGGLVDFDGAFYSAVLHIHRNEWTLAADAIDAARMAMDSHFTALMAESYKRAYPSMVIAQTLSEMEEITAFRKLEYRANLSGGKYRHAISPCDVEKARSLLLSVWRRRLAGCRVDAEVHSSILAVRSLILGPMEEVDATLTFSALSRQSNCFKLAEKALLDPLTELGADWNGGQVFGFLVPSTLRLGLQQIRDGYSYVAGGSNGIDRLVTGGTSSFFIQYKPGHEQFSQKLVRDAGGIERLNVLHQLYYAYVKHLWLTDERDNAMRRLESFVDIVDLIANFESRNNQNCAYLQSACWLKFGDWKMIMSHPSSMLEGRRRTPLPESLQTEVLAAYKRATFAKDKDYKAWHAWALMNFRLAQQLNDARLEMSSSATTTIPSIVGSYSNNKILMRNHVIAAVQGFVKAISLGTKRWIASVQQDMLNFLTCLFKYGDLPEVPVIMKHCVDHVTLEAWLGVLPQLLARIHIQSPSIRPVLHSLLVRLGRKHPQALMYPLSVLLKSPVVERKKAAESLMNSLKAHSSALVEEALMVSSELVRVAILWLELWHEGLEDASRLYFGEGNVSGMLDVLLPLHEQLERGANTRREHDFVDSFGRDLDTAHAHVKEYIRLTTSGGGIIPSHGGFFPAGTEQPQHANNNSRNPPATIRQNAEAEAALNQAWDLYYTVFRRINKQLPGLTTLELSQCSPLLLRAHNLELGIPGSYRIDGSYVKIERINPNIQVISTKQRPRKISLLGSDGRDYPILLKGHEDLRQDERVMQLFGLVNALLVKDRRTNNHELNIQRYTITPLSHNAGIVGWVPHCDTFHSLISDFRDSKKISLNIEHREMMKMAPDYDHLTVMQKVEVFDTALQLAVGKGKDLHEVLWTKSTNSEEWLERRTKFTRSLAVMSMVGYILGLGDRHPSNLMLDQISGRVLHIDFGDCFEVAMHREKYPEKVPFRLTRMLINAMGVSGIEGIFRSTCEQTMGVLRDNKDSLLAMLEAFVYDPLISWRLLCQTSGDDESNPQPIDAASDETGSAINNSIKVPTNRKTKDIDKAEDPGNIPVYKMSHRGGNSVLLDAHPDLATRNQCIREEYDEDDDHISNRAEVNANIDSSNAAGLASYNKSLQMYSNMQSMVANLNASSRIASLTGGNTADQLVAVEESIARSRLDMSVRQKEIMSLLEGEESSANEEALNEKALKAIKRVQDKLTGTDFLKQDEENDHTPSDVPDQVQRLIVQATSSENLCQLYIGWCAFW